MDPAVVESEQFGTLWKKKLLGTYRAYKEQIYAQPLVYTPGDTQYVYIATTMNIVYKIDAKTGDIVLSRTLHVPFLTADLDGCLDINPLVGVTGTGVIDPASGTWYLTAKTYEDQTDQIKGRLNGLYYVHAIDVETLEEKPGFPINLEGTVATNNNRRVFQSGNHHQRPALVHDRGFIYAGFASHCVQYNFTGWIMGWNPSGKLVEAYTTEAGPESTEVRGGGIWMSGGGITADGSGSLFFSTGNGYSSQLHGIPVPGRQPPSALEQAAVHMKIGDDGKLQVVDFFMPWEKEQLDGADKDLGTTPLELLPSQFSCGSIKRLGVVTGKSGKTYFLNMDDLGGYQMGPNKLDAVPKVIQSDNSVYSGAGVYPLEGGYIYINVIQYPTKVLKFSCNDGKPDFIEVAKSNEASAYILGAGHGSTTSLNGQPGTGLYWMTDVQGLNVRIYKAVPNNGVLQLIKSININDMTKFTRPVFGDGRAYIGTLDGLYALGSPVNPPLQCSSPYDFGTVVIGNESSTKSVSCQANIDTEVKDVGPSSTANFKISGVPALPFKLTKGQNITFDATFTPASPGSLSDDIFLNTTNGVANFATKTPISLKGVGKSLTPNLLITPNTVSFGGVILGEQEGGTENSVLLINRGDSLLTVNEITYSQKSEKGPFVTPEETGSGAKVGPFTFRGVPKTIPGNSQATVNVNFNPTETGNFAVYVSVKSDGGSKVFTVVGTAGTYPKALLEFEAFDGSGWVPFSNTTNFTFGDVYQQQTKNLNLRLTNAGGPSAGPLSVTVSKPPVGQGLVAARNSVDLGEGTLLGPGESAEATLFCSVPKSQVNVPSYDASAIWTMNTGDPQFGKQVMHFDCHAVAEQLGPLLSNGSAQYAYRGCWKETNPARQLKVQLWGNDPQNSNGKCINACNARGFKYAGTEYVDECWCGNHPPREQVPDTECDYACRGDETQNCGGNGFFDDGSFLSLFLDLNKLNVSDETIVNPGNDEFESIGCYTEVDGRTLSDLKLASESLTIPKCLTACAGYEYAGAEYGKECWCGNTIRDSAKKTPLEECNFFCAGNDTEWCGGNGRLNVYGPRTILPTSTPASSTSSPATSSSSSALSSTAAVSSATTSNSTSAGVSSTAAVSSTVTSISANSTSDITSSASATSTAEVTSSGASSSAVDSSSEASNSTSVSDTSSSASASSTATQESANSTVASSSATASSTASESSNSTTAGASSTEASSSASNSGSVSSTTASSSATSSNASGSSTDDTPASTSFASDSSAASSSPPSSTAAISTTDNSSASTSSGASSSAVSSSAASSSASESEAVSSTAVSSTTSESEAVSSTAVSSTASASEAISSTAVSSTASASEAISSTAVSSTASASEAISSTAVSSTASDSEAISSTVASSTAASSTAASSTDDSTDTSYALTSFTIAPESTSSDSPASTSSASSDAVSSSTSESSASSSSTDSAPTSSSASSSSSKPASSTSASETSEPASSSSLTTLSTVTSSSTSTTTTSSSSTPSASPWALMGCYNDDTHPRALSSGSFASNSMTPELCQEFCLSRHLPLAGLEYGRECYCGASFLSDAVVPGWPNCNKKCAGDASRVCGGPNRMTVYNYTAHVAPAAPPTVAGYVSDGCYAEPGTGGRAVKGYSFSDKAGMSVEVCINACSARGFPVAGVEYGRECFCGKTLDPRAEKKPARECNMPCSGAPRELCGGKSRVGVYLKGTTTTTTSTVAP
ncbi:MAG: hypothetical protein M1833_001534 [Piccolia ochrophora]|nr:MAG: hypothetical protein M1833_001534 [Piccolia ochrophora]